MALLSRPGLIPLQIENDGNVITTQVNKVNFVGAVTGSIGNFNDVTIEVGTVATASYAISSSYASNATSASYAATASFVAGGASGFPYTGSAQITGSLGITGSFSQSGSTNVFLQGLINQTTAQSHVVTFNNTTGQLFITASSAFGGGGGGGSTPGGANTTIQYNNAGVLDGSNNFTLVGGNTVNLTGSLLVTGSTRFIGSVTGSSFTGSFTGSLFGTSSWAVSASQAVSASYAAFAFSASYAISASTAANILVYCKNQTGFTISKGMVVRITGSNNSSDIPRITTASYENDNNSANTLGIANETITNGNEGYVMTEGVLLGIDTNAYISGQLLYLGATGSITGSAPVAPLHAVRLGEVVRQQSNNGSIYVRIDNGYELGELHNVIDNTTTSSYGDLLVNSGSVWINSKQLTGSYGLTGSLTATSISSSFSGSLTGTSSYADQAGNTNTININSFGSPVESYLLMSNVVATTGVAIGGDSDLRYNSSTNVLTVPNINAVTLTGSLSGSLFGTGSWAVSSSFAISSSFASTSSLAPLYLLVSNTGSMLSTYLPTARTGSFATTGSNTFKSNQTITGSINTTGSINLIGPVTQSNGGNNLTTFNEIIYLPSVIASGPAATLISKPIGPPVSMFIEYQIIDVITNTDQRTGYIMANFNSSGTPTSTFTETVTADIGNTTGVVFSTNVGATYDIQATNSGLNPYTFKAILRYF